MLATEWVAPGQGETAGFLWDLAINSTALRDALSQMRTEFLSKGGLDQRLREKRTRLKFGNAYGSMELRLLMPTDVERIFAAIWEYDEPGLGAGAFYDARNQGGECGD